MPKSLTDMGPKERRKALLGVFARLAAVWILFIGVYFILPIGDESSGRALVKLTVDVLLIGVVIWWQARRILGADYPEVRAMEALGVILVVYLVLFSALYLSMSHSVAATFTERLDHMRALYFTVTVFSTVGFGDITARTDVARAVVSVQMILDLILIGAVVRVLITAARSGLSRPAQTSE